MIDELQVQFHIVEGQDYQTAYKELSDRLSKTHFITWRYPFCWENWKRRNQP
jgi:hypothetical protein